VINGPVKTVKLARKLRSEMSLPEIALWHELRKRPGGFKFRRQHPAGPYVLDFFCAAVRLAIEVDGAGHDGADAVARDARRSEFLRSQHVAVLRVPAKVVLEDLGVAVTRIVEVCEERAAKMAALKNDLPLHHPSDGPPPPLGEDLR
jgi:very-short-patch-repair endonuclease